MTLGFGPFAKYLWTYLVVRLGPLWWGVVLAAGLLAYALHSTHFCAKGAGGNKSIVTGLTVAYATVVVAATTLSRHPSTIAERNLLVAGGIANLLRGGRLGPDALTNTLMLLPLGMLLPVITRWRLSRTTLACLAFSTWIEAVQLVCCLGYPELFDVFLNTLGGVGGYGLWTLATRIKSRLNKG